MNLEKIMGARSLEDALHPMKEPGFSPVLERDFKQQKWLTFQLILESTERDAATRGQIWKQQDEWGSGSRAWSVDRSRGTMWERSLRPCLNPMQSESVLSASLVFMCPLKFKKPWSRLSGTRPWLQFCKSLRRGSRLEGLGGIARVLQVFH